VGGTAVSDPISRAHTRCRICGSTDLVRYLDIGATPLANSYLSAEDLARPEVAVELAIQMCRGCGLSQLTRVVDPDLMFRNYLYVSSTSDTFREHCRELAATVAPIAGCAPGDLALDIASNDGCLLEQFKALGMRTIGVDPALNLATEANQRGITTLQRYWTEEVAREIVATYGRPRVITATNVVAHVDDLHAFVRGVDVALAPCGAFVLEVPYLIDFIEKNEFDTAYHEHLSYLALGPLTELMAAHGLEVFDVEYFADIHGGTIRVYVDRRGERAIGTRVDAMLARERTFGLTDPARYVAFGERVRQNMRGLADLLRSLSTDGRTIWAYGASAKGNTLMSFVGVDSAIVPAVVDDNAKKSGLFTPGAHMRIVGRAELATAAVDYLLLLAWNFEDEIVRRSRKVGYTGKYIRPVPEVTIIE
jgi:hypothetical protein